jgi:hypothetical protein
MTDQMDRRSLDSAVAGEVRTIITTRRRTRAAVHGSG